MRHPPELRERAVRMVAEVREQHETEWAAMRAVSELLGVGRAETVRKWVRQAEIDAGSRPGVSTEESAEFKRLKRENAELKRANAILRSQLGLQLFYDFHEKHRSKVNRFANVPALNMCLVDEDGNADYYDDKNVVQEFDYHDYLDHFSEGVEKWSYMKFPFLTELGREAGSVRVGTLARMNVTHTLSTPLAQQALEKFHAYTGGRANNMTLQTNWARTIEIIHAAEVVRDLLLDPDIQKDDLVVTPPANAWTGEGVGVVEAPRGSLLHHYRAYREGSVTFANLIVATTQNNEVLNRTVRNPGAAASLREGLDEMFTVARLGIDGRLAKTLTTSNPVESMISIARATNRNVTRWRDGQMVLRWTAAGMLNAERSFRRIKGHKQMPQLVKRPAPTSPPDTGADTESVGTAA